MLVKKGTICRTLCCKSKPYHAQFDFSPKQEPLICNGTTYLRGPRFLCLFKEEMVPELNKHGIILHETL